MDTQQWTTYWLPSSLNTVNWRGGGEPNRRKINETSNLILPPLYYGMHRFQTLETRHFVWIFFFLLTACDLRKTDKKQGKQNRIQKSPVPPGGVLGTRQVCNKARPPASCEVYNTQLCRFLPKIFGLMLEPQCR
ncbi:hypothetical protein CHARACLAT_017705 [Characodon lateralis]|uniref:Uncharacterized protein n=1 Tax=Characodon lateralis TaxID=208331 RepID=A0ABU7D2L2_9TELE|nr:hypothetical protein [Characodon lateralis]